MFRTISYLSRHAAEALPGDSSIAVLWITDHCNKPQSSPTRKCYAGCVAALVNAKARHWPAGAQGYQRRATIIATNLAFSEWVKICGDEKLTTALLDRLTHGAHILTTRGDSYRSRKPITDDDQSDQN